MILESKLQRGRFLTLEGGEGAGKSTALSLIKETLEKAGISVLLTREPGGTALGERIRELLIDKTFKGMGAQTELLLFFAARAEHLNQVIRPALAQGQWVISDRFTDASYAYQGGGRGVPRDLILTLESWVVYDTEPDQTYLFDVPVPTGMERVTHRGDKDRFEMEESAFLERVRNTYLERAERFPDRFTLIDAAQSVEEVSQQLREALETRIKNWT